MTTKGMSVIRNASTIIPPQNPLQIRLVGAASADPHLITVSSQLADQYFEPNKTATLHVSAADLLDLAKTLGDATVNLHVDIDFDPNAQLLPNGAIPVTSKRFTKVPAGAPAGTAVALSEPSESTKN
jgi:hypothetical protein